MVCLIGSVFDKFGCGGSRRVANSSPLVGLQFTSLHICVLQTPSRGHGGPSRDLYNRLRHN